MPNKKEKIKCKFDTCNNDSLTKEYCSAHYTQLLRHGFVKEIRKFRFSPVNKSNSTQLCTKCEYWLPFDGFSKRNEKDRLGERNSICKRCVTYRRYDITARDFDTMLKKQKYKCLCCGIKHSESKLQVDHDHACCSGHRSCGDCVRGLLCNDCNAVIGHLKENVKIAKKIVRYLEDMNTK